MTMLNMTISASKTRSNLYQILDDVEKQWSQFTITLRGKPKAVLISSEEFASWQETLELMSNKELTESIRKGLQSKKQYSREEADKLIGW